MRRVDILNSEGSLDEGDRGTRGWIEKRFRFQKKGKNEVNNQLAL